MRGVEDGGFREPADLADAFVRRERAAFDEAYRRYAPSVRGFLRSVATDGSAEDLTQEAFLEAWRRADEYRPERAGLGGWLIMIARSRAIDEHRRRRRRPERLDAEPVEVADPAAGGMDELHARWAFAALLADLSETDRGLLRLRFRDGLSQSEIAQATGLPLGTVKTRMTRALAALRAGMGRREGRG